MFSPFLRKRGHRILACLLAAALSISGSVACMSTSAVDTSVEDASARTAHSVRPDTWVFTDGLGRESLTNKEVGDPRDDRTIAMFYWTWHAELAPKGAVNTTELIKQYPAAKNDYHHPAWAGTGHYCFWNEPIYGFYRTDDEWVLRRQAELLANAGVDVILADNTNGALTWQSGYTALYREWNEAQRKGGVDVPKISYVLPFGAYSWHDEQVRALYADIYRPGKYKNLWYYLDGKPMLMGYNDNFAASSSATDKAINDFFTWRAGYAGYLGSPTRQAMWGWLSVYPQARYSIRVDGKRYVEQVPVGVAVNHSYKTNEITAMNGEYVMGRSYTSAYPNRYEKEGPEASKWGYNFAEQFELALKTDPKVIFVTGWNEWHAWRQPTPWGGDNSKVNNALPDQFDDEHSRDIEPSKGALKDHYYYQLVNFIRRYKGVDPIPTPSENVTINLRGSASQWQNVEPYYAAYKGNTDDRSAQGYGSLRYTETSGRNDIIGAQVARDDEYVCFRVECAETITPYTDNLWMTLYIDSDQENQGWNTFDYVIGKSPASKNTMVLERFTAADRYAQTKKIADVEYKVTGTALTVKVKKADLELSGDDYTINFTWTDNVHDEGDYSKFSGDIMDFYISGDVAPGGRFKYSFISTRENSGKPAETLLETPPETPAPDTDAPTDTLASVDTTPPSSNSGTTADTPSASPLPETIASEPPDEGCGSTFGASVAILAALASAAVLTRKKED